MCSVPIAERIVTIVQGELEGRVGRICAKGNEGQMKEGSTFQLCSGGKGNKG